MPWGGIWGFLTRNWLPLLLSGFVVSWYWRGETIDRLKVQAKGWKQAVATLESALENNAQAIAECEALNAENLAEIARVKADIAEAERRIIYLDRASQQAIEEFARGMADWRNDPECRTLDHPLPDALLDGVRRPQNRH